MRRGSGAGGRGGRSRAGAHSRAGEGAHSRAPLPRIPASPLLLLLLSCQPYTTRPAFEPLPTAAEAFVDQDVARTTSLLSEGLAAESIPVSRVEPKDGYLETGWFNPFTGLGSTARPLGDSVVRVRAWVNAYGEERASIHAETAMRTVANPALPPRELDQQVPPDNPAAVRVARVLATLARRYPVPGTTPPATAGDSVKHAPGDSARAPETIAKPHRDTTPPAPKP
jgi:hypothetical protein